MTTAPATIEASTETSGAPNLADLASAARPDRNRAIDLYRALAMLAVAIGHWMATAVGVGHDGEVYAENALELAPQLSWMTWLFQVMPLFFAVGGFSSAMSLDSFNVRTGGGRPQDWIASRLRRMLAPTVVLGGVWLGLVAVGVVAGVSSLVGMGAVAAAIPLWFLANYTIDTAIAPFVLPAFRARPGLVAGGGVALFCLIEALRFAGVPIIPQLNWVLGWLLFQVLGFAWRDGMLPSRKTLVAISAGLWAAAIGAVAFGPWPVSMVHFPGLINSPTQPPSLALLLYGGAFSAAAIALAPTVSDWLARTPTAWKAVVAANTVAMSVYLWHFTAIIAASAAFKFLGLLPTAEVNSFAWWMQKLPLMGAATIALGLIVSCVAKVEQRSLLAPQRPWNGGLASLLATATMISISLKLWAHSGSVLIVCGAMAVLLTIWTLLLNSTTANR